MNSTVARPEALIMQCVPVPPNCTRTTDYKYVNNTSFVRFGTVRCQSCPCSTSISRLFYVWLLEFNILCKFCASTNFGYSYACFALPSLLFAVVMDSHMEQFIHLNRKGDII